MDLFNRKARSSWPAVLLGGTLALLAAKTAQAAHFSNAYVSFDTPDDWKCALEQTEWVCEPPRDSEGKTAMIMILTAKEVGTTDSPQLYIGHIADEAKRPGVSLVDPPRMRLLGRALWMDATLDGSEVKNYTTRYLARTEGDVGVLVTFSAHKSVLSSAKAVSDLLASSVTVNTDFVRPERRRHGEDAQ